MAKNLGKFKQTIDRTSINSKQTQKNYEKE